MARRVDPAQARTSVGDSQLLSRALSVALLCGGVLVLLGTALTPPDGVRVEGLYGVGGAAVALGAATLVGARRARPWTVHVVLAAGPGLICLGVYFSGGATGMYALMLVWLAVIAASFLSARSVAAHVAWIVVASGVTLALAEAPVGLPALPRWLFGSALVVIAATVVGQIAAGRRATEERLRAEIAERERLQRRLEHLAAHDPLTGLANRRRLEEELGREMGRARREGTPLCVLSLDLDGLKQCNDAHGHAAGDRLLKQAASTWSAALRATDLLARMGGDEFVALLPNCAKPTADDLKDRLRADLAPVCASSAGVACWDGHESPDDLLSRADRAMYEDKARAAGHRPAPPIGEPAPAPTADHLRPG